MGHTWRFVRSGGFDQVAIDTVEDLRHLHELDQKLWVALACPVLGNELDARTLALVDSDDDGRIRAPELLEAIRWTDEVLVDLGSVLEGADGLPLENIADETVRAAAQRVLKGRGKPDATVITVADTTDARAVLDAMPFNGDGVVPPESAEDPAVAQALTDILSVTEGTDDRSGKKGVDRATLERFWTELTAYEAWWKRAESDEDTLVPLGSDTAPAVKAFTDVKAKVDDFFTRCALAAFDPRAQVPLSGAQASFEAMADRQLSPRDDQIRSFPLAAVEPASDLPLTEGINPAWRRAVHTFRDLVVRPILGADHESLDRQEWNDLKQRFSAYEQWLADKAGDSVEPLGVERIRELLASDIRTTIESMLTRDESRKPEADALQSVERAVRFDRDLFSLVHNFVSFRSFYRPDEKAMFQAGVLFLDGRSCELVLRVEDITKHAATAAQSFAYLAYCECRRQATGEKMNIVAAFTDGDSDFLAVGRNGLFYDRLGKDWDATITKVVAQPISIREAFWAPYKRVAKFVSDQAEKFAAAQDDAAQKDLSAKAQSNIDDFKSATAKTDAAKTDTTTKAEPAASTGSKTAETAFDIGKFAGIFAAVGLGLGFVVSAVTMLVTGFLSLRLWQMPLAIGAVLLVISGPSMLLAAFKLARRNLAPLLDANGWAINTRARVNIPFGESLTSVASLPPGARRELTDRYADRRRPWGLLVFLVVLVCAVALLWDVGLREWLGVQVDQAVYEQPADEQTPTEPAPTQPGE